ncbi:Uncharacterised protein [Mycobacteroides abscessus subsp. abscessus]|nr:Uncharacterised protein [Mycobacteroides abscessus subsp. abscessus]SKU78141.1 Uncharacterised protein [Mycobacteroides abscessus subsp. abscessus]
MEPTAEPSGDGAHNLTDTEIAELLFDDLRTMPGDVGSIPQLLRARVGNQFSTATLLRIVAVLAHELTGRGYLDTRAGRARGIESLSHIRAMDLPGLPISSALRDEIATITESSADGLQEIREILDALAGAVIRLESRIEGIRPPQ